MTKIHQLIDFIRIENRKYITDASILSGRLTDRFASILDEDVQGYPGCYIFNQDTGVTIFCRLVRVEKDPEGGVQAWHLAPADPAIAAKGWKFVILND